jgi:hexulose-6-phosphate isomerase
VDPDPRFRDIAVSQIRETIDLATEFEAKVILVFINEIAPARLLLTNQQKVSLLKDSLLKLVRFAEDADVKLALEPSAPSFFASWKQIQTVLDDLGSENIGCYYDVGNALLYGLQPDEEMMKLGDAITQIHLKESRRSMPGKSIPPFPSLGQGTMDWDRIFGSIKSIGYRGYLIVELFSDPSDLYRVAVESKTFIERYMK